MSWVRRTSAALACLPLLIGASCSDDEPNKPSPLDPETSSGSPTESPTATESPTSSTDPTVPASAQAIDEAGAKSFAKYWFSSLSFAMRTGNTAPMLDTSSDDCSSCTKLADGIAEVYREGGRFKTTGWHVELIARAPNYTDAKPDFLMRTRHAARALVDADGKVVDEQPTSKVPMRIVLAERDHQWQVQSLETVQ